MAGWPPCSAALHFTRAGAGFRLKFRGHNEEMSFHIGPDHRKDRQILEIPLCFRKKEKNRKIREKVLPSKAGAG
jgi:hypothetical protein